MSLLVIKVGTGVLTKEEDGTLNGVALNGLVSGISQLIELGHRVILISSGAVGAGVSALQLDHYPESTTARQASAAIGQVRLMQTYQNLFTEHKLNVAQLLISGADLKNERRSKNITNTLMELLNHESIIPIINENDTVATQELRIGDNDQLSSRLAALIKADQLILLTTVDGLLDENNELIESVSNIQDVLHLAKDSKGSFSIGGMASKLEAVQHTLDHKIPTRIANGNKASSLKEIINGETPSTVFSI